jgi:hypothetical protein
VVAAWKVSEVDRTWSVESTNDDTQQRHAADAADRRG